LPGGQGREVETVLKSHVMNSEVSSEVIISRGADREGIRNLLIIGGIEVFLPIAKLRPGKMLHDTTTTEGQPTMTVKEEEEMGQTSEPDPAEEEEHSTEMLEIFSQEAEQGITTTPVAEEEHADKMLTPWEMELEMLEDWLNHPEPVDDCHEQTVMQMLAEEHSEESLKISARELNR
jgi:hypothetical protein